ncbi:MAG: winged helix DNA-binding domain-containing protein [Dehalococcoidales bacterium]|nr:winged helix DNA-binding domain-containing protein [Dehalococcoidales bacterium]
MAELSLSQLRAARLKHQFLTGRLPVTRVLEVVRALGGIQAQLPSAAALALRVRTDGLTIGMVEAATVTEHSLVRTWCLRGTLHLLAAEDVGWMVPLLAPSVNAQNRSRYRQLGLDEATFERSQMVIREALQGGPLLRSEIAWQLEKSGIDTSGQRIAHIVSHAALANLICHGPDLKRKPTYVLLKDWIVTRSPVSEEAGLAELARRFLGGYSPADPADFGAWTGLGMKAARTAWGLIASDIAEMTFAGRSLWMLKKQAKESPDEAAQVVRLLPAFDNCFLGYRNRDWAVAAEHQPRLFHGGQMVPAVIRGGSAIGVWRYQQKGKSVCISVDPFEGFAPEIKPLLREELDDIGRFLESAVSASVGGRPISRRFSPR